MRNARIAALGLAAAILAFITPSACAGDATAKAAPSGVLPEREAAALSFAREHHPELAGLLEKLGKENRREYVPAIRQLAQNRDRLERLKTQSPQQYELGLAAWKLDSRAQLLAARMTMSTDAALETELTRIVRERVDVRLKEMHMERDRISDRLAKLNTAIQSIETNKEAAVDRDLQRIKVSVGKKPAANQKRPSSKEASDKPASKKPAPPNSEAKPNPDAKKSASLPETPAIPKTKQTAGAHSASFITPVPPIPERFATADARETPSFQRHVVPLFGKLGCNGRACHGSFQGRGGFRLSLFGYDFKMDRESLLAGDEPRVNPNDPDASPILQKPTERIPHEGGQRFKVGSWEHHVLLRWIQGGAKGVGESDPKLARLEIIPREITFAKKGETVALKAIAHWSDGTREDVTPLSRFQSNDEQIAAIDANGKATSNAAGDSHVVVFYDVGVVSVSVARPVSDVVGPKYPDVPTPTGIDRLVVQKLRKLGIVPSGLCTDAEFLRRASLDVTGTLPTAEEVAAFLGDADPDKRRKKVDDLLKRPSYAAWWTTRLCDMTGNNDGALVNLTPIKQSASQEWYDWILRRVSDNVPYDKLVEGIVLATSRRPDQSYTAYSKSMTDLYRNGADRQYADLPGLTHFWARRTVAQPPQKALSFAYTFLGIRIQCAECHKHPFDQWTQDDYKDFTKFFARVRFGLAPKARSEHAAILAELKTGPKRGNDLRKEFPRLLKEGKTLPFEEVFVEAPRQDSSPRAERPKPKKPKNAKPKKPEPSTVKTAEQKPAALKKRLPIVAMRPMPRSKPKVAQQPRVDENAALARLLGGERVDLSKLDDPRTSLMKWMRSKDNPFFARAFVNRVWAVYFNVGIVNPPDDLSLSNPPSNAELLDYLADGFVKHEYDMKWLHREIVNSRTYQLSWHPNETNRHDERNFSHAIPRRLPAEVAYDAVRQATASDAKIAHMQTDWSDRAIGVAGSGRRGPGGANYALNVFGRSVRESNCDCDRSNDPSLLQTVFLRNDAEVLAMLNDAKSGWIAQVSAELQPNRSKSPRPGEQQPSSSAMKQRRPIIAPAPTAPKVTAAKTAAKSVADKTSGAAFKNRAKNKEEELNAEQKARLLTQLNLRIKQFQKKGDTERVARLRRRLEELQQRPADRRPVVAEKPRPKAPPVAKSGPVAPKPVIATAQAKTELVRKAYLRTLSRYPDDREMARGRSYLDESNNVVRSLADLVWALVNTREFIVNH